MVVLPIPFLVAQAGSAAAATPCDVPVVNPVACENTKPGTAATDWDISGSGSASLQGYATKMSVQPGETIQLKIKSTVTNYTFDVLRLGYYQGNGARKVAAGLTPVAQPQTQPTCLSVPDSTGLVDCGNWAVSASWAVPATAVSGVYIAHLTGTGGAESHIVFIVRNDASHSDMLFQTSDETWVAYNKYGGNSLYTCATNCPPGSPAAYKGASHVSYNRPMNTAVDSTPSWLFSAEYPMIRFLEANGYDVSYTSGADVSTAAAAPLLRNHKAFLSVGHDEYWSATQRANVEAARDNGVSLAFFSGNEVFWKTRFDPSIDGSNTPNRTLITYKDTHYNAQTDPVAWTGTWQDPRVSPPGDGGRPQNALTGQLFRVNTGTTDIRVPFEYSRLRFWRNTAVASLTTGQSRTLAPNVGTLGFEWDVDPDNGFRPAGAFRLSSTTATVPESFSDYGSTIGPDTVTHNLTLYRASSGALVFGAGTVQWSWGLDNANGGASDPVMQQATVNLFADMGVQPYAVIPGLAAATASTDTTAPTSSITTPGSGATVGDGGSITITGTASDAGGGVVAGVEVSTDDGSTWHPATGTTSWSYPWVTHGSPSAGIKTRAVDDSGNVETPSAGDTLSVPCTCSVWGTGSVPTLSNSGTTAAVEVGVKFKSDVSGFVTGVRFYKSSLNTGSHVGSLWSASGTRLATATFAGETASGWQQVTFTTPVQVNANSVYVASYFAPNGHTAADASYFYPNPSPSPYAYSRVDSPPLHALRNTGTTVNGVFLNTSVSAFPNQSSDATNYWVDVMFNPNTGPATEPGAPTSVSAVPSDASAKVTWAIPSDGGSAISSYTVTPYVGTTAQTPTIVTGGVPQPSATVEGLANGTTYTFKVTATNAVGSGPASAASNAVTPAAVVCNPCTVWPSSAAPAAPDDGDPGSIEVGVKFRADVNGQVRGIRFYKATANTGTHIGSLWTLTGTKLASVTFTGETATGWQQGNFATPVTITAGTIYVASYFAPNGHYPGEDGFFSASGVDNGPMHALRDGVSGGNGVYRYGTGSVFPSSTYVSENYWVDVDFSTVAATAPAAPDNVTATAGSTTASVSWTAPADGGRAISSYTVTPFVGTTAQTPTTVSGSPPITSATVTGLTNGTTYTFKVTATNSVGTGPASAASNAITPNAPTAPAAPTNVTATGGTGSASVAWTAPSNGGNPITSYTVTPYIGTTAQTSTTLSGNPPATTVNVSGLTNGTAYTFRVTATNAIGTSPASAASNAVTPTAPTAPAAPTTVTATAANGSASVTWTAPSNGGSAITSYTVTPFVGTTAQAPTTVSGSPPATSATLTGLTNGTAYTFQVTATNAVGTGPASAASNAVTPVDFGCTGCTIWPASATPANPAIADTSSLEVGVKFRADVAGNITGIRFYKGSGNTGTHIGNLWNTLGTKLATVTFSGETTTGWQQANFATPVAVTAGTVYVASYFAPVGRYAGDGGYFAASEVNNAPLHALQDGVSGGNGVYAYSGASTFPVNTYGSTNYWVDVVFASSSASAPGAPTGVTATAADSSATVTWTAPSNGGSPITGYTVTPFAGTTAQTPTVVSGSPPATSATVTGLTNGTAYTFRVTATNGVGTSTASAASSAVTPTGAGVPAAPAGVTATAGNASAAVTWTAPSNGGSPITGYTITPFVGTTAQTPTTVSGSPPATSATVTGLTNGTAYTFQVTATNAVGTGPASAPSNAVTPTAPSAPAAPTNVTATAGSGSASVTWTAPSSGSSPITSYTVTPFIGTTAQTPTTVSGSPPATSATVTGLTNGTDYTFQVAASNAVGTGPASTSSNAVTPTAPTAPAAPTGVSATASSGSASVAWTAPSNGGSAITSYMVTPFVGTTAQTPTTVSGSPPATSATVTGLTNGTAYTFRVTATNVVGTSAASAASNTVTPVAGTCSPCTIWPSTAIPVDDDVADGSSVELGVKFRADVAGTITGIRFYKGAGNTGTHVGTLWTTAGTRLASATFSDQTATGWQQANFDTPVAVTSGTVYVASYFSPIGHYAADGGFFTSAGVDNVPLHALQDGVSGGNGVYAYGSTSTFPNNSFGAANYWVDVLFTNTAATAPGAPTGVTATGGDASASVTWGVPSTGGSAITSYTVTPYVGTTAQAPVTVSGSPPATALTVTGLTNGTPYTFRVTATNAVGTGPASAASNAVTPSSVACTACTIWPSTAAPTTASTADATSVEVGVKFTSDVNGFITGIRFYKGTGNTGTHVGNLWTTSGTRLATANFTGETATGWQQVTFPTRVAITAGTVYVASYFAPVGRYAGDSSYFNSSARDNAPLHALKNGTSGGNGVYAYGGSTIFPTNSFKSTNYWVDVVFSTG